MMGAAFLPGRLCQADYAQRRDATTQEQVAQLLRSSAYSDWSTNKHRLANKQPADQGVPVESLLVMLAVGVVTLVLLQPMVLSNATQQGALMPALSPTGLSQEPVLYVRSPPTAAATSQGEQSLLGHLSQLASDANNTARRLPQTRSDFATPLAINAQLETALSQRKAEVHALAHTQHMRRSLPPAGPCNLTSLRDETWIPAAPTADILFPLAVGMASAMAVVLILSCWYRSKLLLAAAEDGALKQELERVQGIVDELQLVLLEKDEQLLSIDTELMQLEQDSKMELAAKEDVLREMRRWLDQAQGQLQNTQTALTDREHECKCLGAQLKTAVFDLKELQDKAFAWECKERELTIRLGQLAEELLAAQEAMAIKEQECQRLSARLQDAIAETEAFEDKINSMENRQADEDAFQAELRGQVSSVIKMMKHTRLNLSTKLSNSQNTCQAIVTELQDQKLKATQQTLLTDLRPTAMLAKDGRDCASTECHSDDSKQIHEPLPEAENSGMALKALFDAVAVPSPISFAAHKVCEAEKENTAPDSCNSSSSGFNFPNPQHEVTLKQRQLSNQSASPYWFAK